MLHLISLRPMSLCVPLAQTQLFPLQNACLSWLEQSSSYSHSNAFPARFEILKHRHFTLNKEVLFFLSSQKTAGQPL